MVPQPTPAEFGAARARVVPRHGARLEHVGRGRWSRSPPALGDGHMAKGVVKEKAKEGQRKEKKAKKKSKAKACKKHNNNMSMS